MIATTDPLTAARSAALFVSSLCATDDPTRAQIEAAIQQSLLTHGGSRGCAADVAAAYGDYPELAAPRMRWARGVVLRLYGRPASAQRRPRSVSARLHFATAA